MLRVFRKTGVRQNGRVTTKRNRSPLLVELLEDRRMPAFAFLGVAAGDATTADEILWTRAVDASMPASVHLTAEVATDPSFGSFAGYSGITDATQDYTLKLDATGLQAGTRYYYRFVTDDGQSSLIGTFVTAPSATTSAALHFGFTGDADGQMRPYDAADGVTAPGVPSFANQNFDNFIWLGDTIYETASGGSGPNSSPATPSTAVPGNISTPAALQIMEQAFWRKYREQFLPVSTGADPGLQSFFSSTGHYTLLDNHELGNKQVINGGAAPGSNPFGIGVNPTDPANDVNTSGAFMNQSPIFQTLEQAYTDYQPIRVQTVNAPGDPRSNGTQQLYFAQQWGANAIIFNLDDRSYRDIRLKQPANPGADDTGVRADNPGRTMLGATQLNWFEQGLLDAQANGVTWKFVAISSPIDQIGAIGSGDDGGKSWMGGYRYERNQMLKFIADHHIDHVVFLSTDDHQVRVNELGYFTQFDANGTPIQSSYTRVPGVFEIVVGPIGATGPDTITDHSFANINSLATALVNKEVAAGVDPIGLDPSFAGLQNVWREGDATAGSNPKAVDFYSPDTFNYASLDIDATGRTFTVTVYGQNSYAVNTFPQPDASNPVRKILSFQIGLEATNLNVHDATGVYAGTATLAATLTDANSQAPLVNKLVTFTLGNTVVGTAITDANGVATLSNVDVSNYEVGVYPGEIKASFNGDAGAFKASGSGTLVITHVALAPDPADPSKTALFVGGTADDDVIQIKRDSHSGQIRVQINSAHFHLDQSVNGDVSRIVAFGGPGGDNIRVDTHITTPAMLFGGAGDDILNAGGGTSVLVGGAGQDILFGGDANDVLIGGTGSDSIFGRGGQDLLIAGVTDFDNNLAALVAVSVEWGRSDEAYDQRVANLQNSPSNGTSPNGSYAAGFYLTSATVHDDGAGNYLYGNADRNWYFANLDGVGNNGVMDEIFNLRPGDVVTHITL